MRNTRWAFAGTKKKTSTVRDVVDGDDNPRPAVTDYLVAHTDD